MVVTPQPCKFCGRLFVARNAVQGAFCSKGCRFLYRDNPIARSSYPPFEPESSTTIIKNRAEYLPVERGADAPEDLGEAWKRAGITYSAMTRRALSDEHFATSRRSIVISGNGANLSVKNGALIVKNGVSYMPQEIIIEELERAVHGVYRIVWVGASGTLSYNALKWCYEQKVDLLILDKNGDILCESTPNKSADARVKRAQYHVSPDREIEVAKWLILGKVTGQYETYHAHSELQNDSVAETFSTAFQWLALEPTPTWLRDLNNIRLTEARVANAYFSAWIDLPLQWKDKVPSHWNTAGTRNSPLTSSNTGQKAVKPAQAILNYAYGILEHAAKTALLAVGLDRSVGILHADKPGRDSLVFDLMELGRGTVDDKVLTFFRKTEFNRGDFVQLPTGEVRLHPELARAVVAMCSIFPDSMIEHARVLRNMLLAGQPSEIGESDKTDTIP